MNDFEAMSIMSKENKDIKLFPEIVEAKLVHKGKNGNITFGTDAETVTRLAKSAFTSNKTIYVVCYAINKEQFDEIKSRSKTPQ